MEQFEENNIILHSYLDNFIGKVELFDEDVESCEDARPRRAFSKIKLSQQ